MDKYNVIFPPLRHTALGRAMLALLISLVCTLLWGTTRISPVYAETKSATGVVYVESNIPTLGGNSILAYRRSDAGDLTPLPCHGGFFRKQVSAYDYPFIQCKLLCFTGRGLRRTRLAVY